MESGKIHRRLKKLRQTEPTINKPESISDCDLISICSSASLSESSESEKQVKTKKQPKKKVPKLPTLNKLLDFSNFSQDLIIEDSESLRNAELEFLPTSKAAKKTFVGHTGKDQNSYKLAKSVLTNVDARDSLIVNAPLKVHGFIEKTINHNPRDIFRDKLKSVINERKTNHIGTSGIFDKSISDFDRKQEEPLKNNNDSVEIKEQIKECINEKSQGLSDSAINEKVSESAEVSVRELNEFQHSSLSSTSVSSPFYESSKSQRSVSKVNNESRTASVSKYLENEAERSGSDHSSDTSEDIDEDLESLIDNSDHSDEFRDAVYRKHINNMLEQEYKDLKVVADGKFKRKPAKDIIALAKKVKLSTQPQSKPCSVFSQAKPSDSESDEDQKVNLLKEMRGIRNFRNIQKKALLIDEKSNDFLKLINKPEQVRTVKTLLNTGANKAISPEVISNTFFKIVKKETLEDRVIAGQRQRSNTEKILLYVKK